MSEGIPNSDKTCRFYLSHSVHMRKKRVAFETSCLYSVVCVRIFRGGEKFLLRTSDVLNVLLELYFVEILSSMFLVLSKDGSSTV